MKIKTGLLVVVGDALDVPIEFYMREDLEKNPVIGMKSYGTYNKPAGTWSDDTSLTIATIANIINKKLIIQISWKSLLNGGRIINTPKKKPLTW